MTIVTVGRSEHFELQYDDSLTLDAGRAAAEALVDSCEEDLELVSTWFAGVTPPPAPIFVSVVPAPSDAGGASADVPGLIRIVAGPEPRPERVRFLLVAQLSKQFMRAQAKGWLDDAGGGPGYALATFLGAQSLAARGLGAPDLDLQPANAWMESPREDYLNGPGSGPVPDGCRVLFLYFLLFECKFTVARIVGAGAPTMVGVYRVLTGRSDDPFPEFKRLLDQRYPGTRQIPGTLPDNPWPIGHLAEDLEDDSIPIIPWGRGGFIY